MSSGNSTQPQSQPNPAYAPKVFTDEEIDMFLAGDRRQIDRHILNSLNRIAIVLIANTDREDKFYDQMENIGGIDAIHTRADYVDSLIEKNKLQAAAFAKISQSTVTYALIAFLGFIAAAVWHDIIAAIKLALKAKS